MPSFNTFEIDSQRGYKVSAWSIIPETPTAAIHILHGMMEHSARYKEFAEWMAGQGFAVYSADHPGHGLTVRDEHELGHLDDRQGWDEVLEAVVLVQDKIRSQHPDLKVFILGHSFGSVVGRSFTQRFLSGSPLAGLILSGSMQQPPALLRFGMILTALLKMFRGQQHRSRLMITLGHGQYAKFFAPNRSSFDWLSADPDVVDNYVNDPLCGYACSLGYYRNFFRALLNTWKASNIQKLPSSFPVLFIGGKLDPATRFGKDIRLLSEKYMKTGMKMVRVKLYKSGRHEMLNEVNRQEVWEYLRDWMRNSLKF
jgi:alpha-beta hydrolase superfamily lysophospholipase